MCLMSNASKMMKMSKMIRLPALNSLTRYLYSHSSRRLSKAPTDVETVTTMPAKVESLSGDLTTYGDHLVASADDGRTIVCYHPDRPFPYEHSLAVPRMTSELNEGDSILRVQFRQDWIDETATKNKELDFEQLARIFSQTKHDFLPKPHRDRLSRYATRHLVKERDGL